MATNIITLTEATFEQAVGKHNLMLVDFWAEWCAPCKDFQKVIEQVAPEYPEFTFAGVDIEQEKELVEDFNIRSVPAVMIIRDTVVVYAESGALTATALRELLDQTKALDPEEIAKIQKSS